MTSKFILTNRNCKNCGKQLYTFQEKYCSNRCADEGLYNENKKKEKEE